MKVTATDTRPLTIAETNPVMKANLAKVMAAIKAQNPALHDLMDMCALKEDANGQGMEGDHEFGSAAMLQVRYKQGNDCEIFFYLDTDILDISLQGEGRGVKPEDAAKALVKSFTSQLLEEKKVIKRLIKTGELFAPFKSLVA